MYQMQNLSTDVVIEYNQFCQQIFLNFCFFADIKKLSIACESLYFLNMLQITENLSTKVVMEIHGKVMDYFVQSLWEPSAIIVLFVYSQHTSYTI